MDATTAQRTEEALHSLNVALDEEFAYLLNRERKNQIVAMQNNMRLFSNFSLCLILDGANEGTEKLAAAVREASRRLKECPDD